MQQSLVFVALAEQAGRSLQGWLAGQREGQAEIAQRLAEVAGAQQAVELQLGPGVVEQALLRLLRGIQAGDVGLHRPAVGRQ